jgi:hypothetical protein
MPIRINLLAEQQFAEEARRKDPIKRAIIIGSAVSFLMVVWVLTLFMQLKARRAELVNLDAEFKRVDEKAKVVRNIQAEAGDLERRLASLEKYSTNRTLWANMLDALQKGTLEQIRLKSVTSNQRYPMNPPTIFFTTNINVAFTPPPASWKFWAGPPSATPIYTLASNVFKTFTNAPPFNTNTLNYATKMTVKSTNLIANTVQIVCDFTLPAVATEDIDMLITGGDYGNPPGATLDTYLKQLTSLPYFVSRLSHGEDRGKYIDISTRPEPDISLPDSPLHKRFTLRMKYEDRILTND